MQFIDSHCHVHFDDFLDPEQVVADAIKNNVGRLICVGVSLEDSQKAVDFAQKHNNVWATVGAHPHDGLDYIHNKDAGELLNKLSNNPKVVAIGEIGLDYFKNYSPKEDQQKALRQQIEIGLTTGLPFVFHIRDAWDDFWKIFDAYGGIQGVVHSFSAHEKQLEQVLSRNLYVGLNGIMTFTRDEYQLEAAKKVPLNKMLLETDAPFLAPKPFRGQICEPKHVVSTAEFLAGLRGENLEDIAASTTNNAVKLFNLEPVSE
jgi:TatD DNase family protein